MDFHFWMIATSFRQSGYILLMAVSGSVFGVDRAVYKSIERAPFSSALAKDELAYPSRINLAKTQFPLGSIDSGSSSKHPCASAQIAMRVSSLSLI